MSMSSYFMHSAVLRTGSYYKPLKMFMYEPAGGWTTEASGEAFGAICRLDLHAERSEDVYAPASSRFAILLVA